MTARSRTALRFALAAFAGSLTVGTAPLARADKPAPTRVADASENQNHDPLEGLELDSHLGEKTKAKKSGRGDAKKPGRNTPAKS